MTATATPTAAPTAVTLRRIPLAQLVESRTNPRKTFKDMEDLTASVREKGVRVPLHVRPVDGLRAIGLAPEKAATGRELFEILAGARRFRAATLAGVLDVPAIVEDMNDHDARELQILENLQRKDVHPLDEAEGFRDLMAFDPAYTIEVIAVKFGKSERYVRDRLKLCDLVPEARETFGADRITIGHAILIARLPAAQQPAALEACFYPLYGSTEETSEAAPVGKLRDWINQTIPVDITRAPEMPELFSDEDSARIATAIQDAEGDPSVVRLVTREWTAPKLPKGSPKVLGSRDWKEITGKKDRCAHAQVGVIGLGRERAQVLTVCATKTCTKHFPPAPPAVMREGAATDPNGVAYNREAQQREQERQRAEQLKDEQTRAQWKKAKPDIYAACVGRIKTAKVSAMATLLAERSEHFDDAVEFLGKPKTADDIVRVLALAELIESADHEWSAPRVFPPLGRRFGVDVAPILKKHAPATSEASAPAKAKTGKKR